MTLEFLTERIAFSGGRVDAVNHVIRNVKILGTESRNGREYPPATIRAAASKYEGAKVNVNHPKGSPSSPRDYQDRIGSLQNVRVDGAGLYGDLKYNPGHPVAPMLEYDAEHNPGACGLSHNVQARTSRGVGGKLVVEAIERVTSVDLVADPATTGGLFEHVESVESETLASPTAGWTFLEILRGRQQGGTAELVEAVTGKKSKPLTTWADLIDALELSDADAEYLRTRLPIGRIDGRELFDLDLARELLARRDRKAMFYPGSTAVEDQPEEETPEAFVAKLSGKTLITESARAAFARALK